MQPMDIRIFHKPPARLRVTVGDRSYIDVRPVWNTASPHTECLTLLDNRGEEIVRLLNPSTLSPESLTAVREELARRHFTSIVTHIEDVRFDNGMIYWSVETNRGPREFVMQNSPDSIIRLTDDHLLLVSVVQDRFEIPSVAALNRRSRLILRAVL